MRMYYHKEDAILAGVILGFVILIFLSILILPSRIGDTPEKAAKRVMEAIYHKDASALCNEIHVDELRASGELMDPFQLLDEGSLNDQLLCLKAKQIDFDNIDSKQRLVRYEIRDVLALSETEYRVEVPIAYFSEGLLEPSSLYLLIQEKDGRFWYIPN